MVHENPWYIITRDEIEEIRNQLNVLRDGFPGNGVDRVTEIDALLKKVRDRRP